MRLKVDTDRMRQQTENNILHLLLNAKMDFSE